MPESIELFQDTNCLAGVKARDLSKHAFRFTVGSLWQTSWLWKLESVVVCC